MTTSTAQIMLSKIETQAYRRGNFMCQSLDVEKPDEQKVFGEIQEFIRFIANTWKIDRSSQRCLDNGDSPSIAQIIACAARGGISWHDLNVDDRLGIDDFVLSMYSNWDDRVTMVTEYITDRDGRSPDEEV